MKTVDVVIREMTAEATFHLSVLADLLRPTEPERLEDQALSDRDYLSSVEHVLERVVCRLEALDPALNVMPQHTAVTIQQQARQHVIAAIRDLEERLMSYITQNFAALAGQYEGGV